MESLHRDIVTRGNGCTARAPPQFPRTRNEPEGRLQPRVGKDASLAQMAAAALDATVPRLPCDRLIVPQNMNRETVTKEKTSRADVEGGVRLCRRCLFTSCVCWLFVGFGATGGGTVV